MSLPISLPHSRETADHLTLPARLAILGGLVILELLTISIWLDAELLRGRGALANLVHDWGAWTVRLSVAIVLGSLIFAESRAKTNLERISSACAASRVSLTLLAAHLGAMAVFVALSSLLFQHHASGNALVLAWGITGVGSFALAACALIPLRIWTDIFRSTGDAWLYGLAAALVACTLGILAQRLWSPLSHWTLSLVAVTLRPFLSPLLIDPSQMSIGTTAFHVEIAPQCSGYEGMGLMLAFSSAWLWFFRPQWRFPQAFLLIPIGVALIWLANAARIAGLVLIGNAGAEQIALGGFHSQAGWIAFNAIAIGICVGARRIPWLVHGMVHDAAPTTEANPTAPYLMPFLAILGAAMISRAASDRFEWLYPLRIVAAALALWYFRKSYRDLDFRFSWLGPAAGALVFAIWIGLDRGSSPAPAALLHASSPARISWIALRMTGAVLTVPIAEELAFRGFLLRRLSSSDFESVSWRFFSWAPFLISSAAFGLLHGDRWLAGTIAGAIFALAQLRRGRIGEAIATHAVANAMVAAWVLQTGSWQLW
jgi:exosortase E/protease (VPEID-CTERM system)